MVCQSIMIDLWKPKKEHLMISFYWLFDWCFTVISFDSLLVYESKYYLQVYVDNCTYKTVDKQNIDYFGDCLFEFY